MSQGFEFIAGRDGAGADATVGQEGRRISPAGMPLFELPQRQPPVASRQALPPLHMSSAGAAGPSLYFLSLPPSPTNKRVPFSSFSCFSLDGVKKTGNHPKTM